MNLTLLILALMPIAAKALADYGNNTRTRRSGISYVWPNGIIPYRFEPDFPAQDRAMFLQAVGYIGARTCVTFREKTDSDHYWVNIILGGCCGAHRGRLPEFKDKGQGATFSSGLPLPFYLHELGHTIGFPHEQDRPDRDDFIYWDKEKEDRCKDGDFAGKTNDLDQGAIDIPFDYVALMADWTECYWPKPPTPKEIPLGGGSSDDRTFSVIEIERMNAMHQCRGCYGYRFIKLSQLAWNTDPYPAGNEVDGKTFYICRTYHKGHLLIGKSLPDENKCYLGYDGDEVNYPDNFSVLTNPRNDANLKWIDKTGNVPSNAIKGGRTTDRKPIYIGRCTQTIDGRQTVIPGYFLESNPNELKITYGGGGRTCNDFQILVCS